MKRREVLFGGAIGLIVLALAVPALAGVGPIPVQSKGNSHGLHYAAGTFDGPIIGSVAVTGACEDGDEVVLGGGGSWRGPAKRTQLVESQPGGLELGEAWNAQGTYSGDNPPFTVHLICAERKALYVSDSRSLDPGQKGTVTVTCPKDHSVTQGGAHIFSGSLLQSMPIDSDDSDFRQDDGWRATGRGSAKSSQLVVSAVCINSDPGELKYVKLRSDVDKKSSKSFGPSCPKSKSVTGGGIALTANGESEWISSLRPTDNRSDPNKTPDDRWTSTVYNGANRNRSVTAYAICLG